MKYEVIYKNLSLQLDYLTEIVEQSEARIFAESPDNFFVVHVNFLVKSYLISLCSYLEVFLKDLACEHIRLIQCRLNSARVPHNIVVWSVAGEGKEKGFEFKDFSLPLDDKKVGEEISGNPFKTVKIFKLMGVDIESEKEFKEIKDLVNSIVGKRNLIIHHNDDASDISLNDIKNYKEYVLSYAGVILSAVRCSVSD